MHFIFLFLSLLNLLYSGLSTATPIPFEDLEPTSGSNPSNPLVKPSFFVFDQTRGVREIVWSCLATTFACTWIAVHPNIPALGESWWTVNQRRLKTMLWALIVPEMIMWWALRQAAGASRIQEKHKGNGWTKCHGFFIQMGGFVLSEPGGGERTLSVDELEELHQAGKVSWPTITQEEIWDKSKGDLLAKSFIMFQALWFIVQCILRALNQLTVTELELVTLGYALLNAFIYALWWNKPLDVRYPVLIESLLMPDSEESYCAETIRLSVDISDSDTISKEDAELPVLAIVVNADDNIDILSADSSTIHSELVSSLPAKDNVDELPDNIADYTQMVLSKFWKSVTYEITDFVGTLREEIHKQGAIKALKDVLLIRPFSSLIVDPLCELSRCDTIPANARRVPTFYAVEAVPPADRPSSHPVSENMRWFSCFAIPVGAIHFTANMSAFPTNSERVLWVTASLLTSLLPILFTLVSPVVAHGLTSSGPLRFIQGLGSSKAFVIIGITLYTVSRIMLLVQALALLRALPPKALLSIPWMDYFPHL